MKKLVYIVASVAAVSLSSCSKTLILSDGNASKEIKMFGKINVSETNKGSFANFMSVKGTHYHIDLAKFTYKLKTENQPITASVSIK